MGVVFRYWEGDFVLGGWKWHSCLKSGGWKCCSRGRGCLEMCLKAVGAGESLSSCPRNSENVAAFSEFLCPPHPLGRNFPPPSRTKLCLVVPGVTPTSFTVRALFGDVLTLPVQLRPPEMGILVDIGAVCRYWEGGFVSGGWKCESIFRISGREVKTALALAVGCCLLCLGAGLAW